MNISIIGSGIAGLTAGAVLAKAGHAVDIYEQYHRPGGLTATIEQDGFQWDLGQLLLEGLGADEPLGEIFSDLGIFDQIPAVPDHRDYVFPDYQIRRPAHVQDARWRMERLKQQFPGETHGLDQYWKDYCRFTRVMTIGRSLGKQNGLNHLLRQAQLYLALLPLLPKASWSAEKLMNHYFHDEALKMVFISILADFFTPPSEFQGLGVYLLNSELSFDKRLPKSLGKDTDQLYFYSILGGIKNLIQPFVDLIESRGGTIHLNAPVEKVLIENGQARGVRVHGVDHPADRVFCSGSAHNAFFDLIGKEHLSSEFIQLVDGQHLMDGVFMVHLGLDMDPSTYVDSAVTYYYGTYDLEGAIENARKCHYHRGKEGFVVHIPTMHTPDMAPRGMHAMTIYTICPNCLQEGSWTKYEEEFADDLVHYAENYFPGLKDHIVTRKILSPLEFQEIAHMRHFAFGGLAPVNGAPRIPMQTPIEGFYFIGQQSESGGGVNAVMNSTYQFVKKLVTS